MNRRDFIHHLALLAAGAAALPAQISAFEHAFTINAATKATTNLCVVNEIFIGGLATHSTPAIFEVYAYDRLQLVFPLNLFGGLVRWVGSPDMPLKITTLDGFRWHTFEPDSNGKPGIAVAAHEMDGSIRYIDQQGMWHTVRIGPSGTLSDARK